MAEPSKTVLQFESRLREKRQALGLSQSQLAAMCGITRQAVAAIETNQYSPATSVALQLSQTLGCRVEDLFSIKSRSDIVEGELLGSLPKNVNAPRAQVSQIGKRWLVRPLDGAGPLNSLTASADGLIVDIPKAKGRTSVALLRDRELLRRQIVIGGCDPALFLAAEHLRQRDKLKLVPWLMGNSFALSALKRGEVHAAGIHRAEDHSANASFAEIARTLGSLDYMVVTFAHWEEGLILPSGNPKNIRSAADLARPKIRIINRESGSGARRLLDRMLRSAGISIARINGYGQEVFSHLEVASHVRSGFADAGVGVRAAATMLGLDFLPLQRERYSWVIPKLHYASMEGLKTLLDVIVGKSFRDELEALGGYDTRETGKIAEYGDVAETSDSPPYRAKK